MQEAKNLILTEVTVLPINIFLFLFGDLAPQWITLHLIIYYIHLLGLKATFLCPYICAVARHIQLLKVVRIIHLKSFRQYFKIFVFEGSKD